MRQADSVEADEFYMYNFRTKFCSMRGKCPNPTTCVDAHSKIMKRRVPTLNEETGKYNYIPEACPQWRRSKNCNFGDNCPRSHGWLEVIYHPLLYKTKLCKSKRKNGICAEYGVYCAKAHNRIEVRSLVNIFGLDWKRHYDLSGRFGFGHGDNVSGFNGSMKRHMYNRNRVGLAVIPNTYQTIDINLFAGYLLEKQSSMQHRSRKLEQSIAFEAFYNLDVGGHHFRYPDTHSLELQSSNWKSSFATARETVSSPLLQKFRSGCGSLRRIWEQECRSQSTECKTQGISDISSHVQDDYESLSWRDTDWLMLCEKGSSQSDEQVEMSGLNSDRSEKSEFNYDRMPQNGFESRGVERKGSSQGDEQCEMSGLNSDESQRSEYNYDRMPQNWFKSRCLEKASEVFLNRSHEADVS